MVMKLDSTWWPQRNLSKVGRWFYIRFTKSVVRMTPASGILDMTRVSCCSRRAASKILLVPLKIVGDG